MQIHVSYIWIIIDRSVEKTNREDEEEDNDNEKKNMLTHLDKSVVLGSWHTTMYYQHYIVFSLCYSPVTISHHTV